MRVKLALYTPDEIDEIAGVAGRLAGVLDELTRVLRTEPSRASRALRRLLDAAGQVQIVPAEFAERAGAAFGFARNSTAAHGTDDPVDFEHGDIVTVDLAVRDAGTGWHADVSRAAVIGGGARASRLAAAADAVTRAGLDAVRPGGRWAGVVGAMKAAADAHDVRIVSGLAGHGIGRASHERPATRIAPFDSARDDFELRAGLVFTVEPVVTDGLGGEPVVGADAVSLMMSDHGWCACREEMVAITAAGVRVLSVAPNAAES